MISNVESRHIILSSGTVQVQILSNNNSHKEILPAPETKIPHDDVSENRDPNGTQHPSATIQKLQYIIQHRDHEWQDRTDEQIEFIDLLKWMIIHLP